jgi:chloride channel protein, CIC family
VRYLLGAPSLFHLAPVHAGGPRELLGYAAVGVVAGCVSLMFDRLVCLMRARANAMPRWSYCVQVGTAGFAVGAIAYLGFPQIMSTGYGVVGHATFGQFGWKLLLGLAALKFLLSALSFATRTPGGIIAPVLFIGATLGCTISGIEHSLIAQATASTSAYALVGMGVLFAGVLKAPLTALLLVLELGGNYGLITPAIIAIGLAYLLTRTLQPRSLFEQLRRQDGVHLPTLEDQKTELALQVRDAMQAPDFPVVDGSLTLRQAWREVVDRPGDLIFVRHADDGWTIIDRPTLDQIEAISDPQQRLEDAMDGSRMPHLYPDLRLDTTLGHLHRWPVLPVVSRANVRTLEGVVTMEAVMARYQSFKPSTESRSVSPQCA